MVGRDVDALEEAHASLHGTPGECSVISADLSEAEGVEQLISSCADVDVLIANAGVTSAAETGSLPRSEIDRLTYLMGAGVVRLCEGVVPGMVARGGGTVVIVSSIAAFTPMRKSGPYAASKAFSTSYAKSLSLEVAAHGVDVVAVCPGYVHTNLHARAGLHHLEQKVPQFLWCSPEDVVEEAQRALRRNRVVCVPGRAYRLTRPFLSSRPAQYVWGRLTARTSSRSTSP